MAKDLPQHPKSTAAWAPLVIRVVLGVTFIAHGSQKLFGAFGGHGLAGLAGFLDSTGIRPGILWAWAAAIAEFAGGIGILLGVLTGLSSIAIIVTMLVAIVLVHGKNGFFINSESPGFEYNLALIAMAASLVVSGPGKLSVDRLIRHK